MVTIDIFEEDQVQQTCVLYGQTIQTLHLSLVVHLLPKPISERRGVVYSGRIFTAAGFVVE